MHIGRILKGIGGFYYVKEGSELYESKASALFRIKDLTPTVGDFVEFEKNEDGSAYIKEIRNRKNLFIRPPVSNIDEVFLVVSILNPQINNNLLDKMILLSRYNGVEPVIIINKVDLDLEKAKSTYKDYTEAGFRVYLTTNKDENSINNIKEAINKKTILFMGPSGVGKSTLISHLTGLDLAVGEVSEKTNRGKHTTRHVELLNYSDDSYIVDTPGFSSLSLDFIKDIYHLEELYYEFNNFGLCKFSDCVHINEPDCKVKEAVEETQLKKFRYENYQYFINEIKKRR